MRDSGTPNCGHWSASQQPVRSRRFPEINDTSWIFDIGANWAISRSWGLSCNASHESREVSGGANASYTNNAVGCAAQYRWP